MSAQQQVITIDDISADNAPAIYVAGGLGQFFEAVKTLGRFWAVFNQRPQPD